MKTRLAAFLVVFLGTPIGQALACSVCYGAQGSKVNDHMAIAIWVMLGAIMSVLGGVGGFSFYLWRHAQMPLEPHQELTQEDLAEYD